MNPVRMCVLVVVVAGCGGDGAFSGIELRAIRTRLAVMPATAAPDPSNAVADDPAAAALGRALFFDPRYSANGEVACATCHDPATGFQDARANTSLGLDFTGRHAPTVLNAALVSETVGTAHWQFWDGRVDSMWAQAIGPPESEVEMGGSRTRIAYLIHDAYQADYEAVFGGLPALRDGAGGALYPVSARPGTTEWDALDGSTQDAITEVYVNFGKAIAAYERQLLSRGARYDEFLAELADADDSDVFDADEKLGLRLFIGKAACMECHNGPALTDWRFHNIGLDQAGSHLPGTDSGRAAAIATVTGSEFNCAGPWSDHPDKDGCAVNQLAGLATDLGAFKTPGLRDLAATAPYFHTGLEATLDDVVAHYDKGGDASGFTGVLDEKMHKLELAADEKAALLAFLATLDGVPLPDELATAPILPDEVIP